MNETTYILVGDEYARVGVNGGVKGVSRVWLHKEEWGQKRASCMKYYDLKKKEQGWVWWSPVSDFVQLHVQWWEQMPDVQVWD